MAPALNANTRYLASKKTVDDRALNKDVLRQLETELALASVAGATPRVVEIGAGLGTMAARLAEWHVLPRAEYLLMDVDTEILSQAREHLNRWAADRGHVVEPDGDALRIRGAGGVDLRLRTLAVEIGDFLQRGSDAQAPDRRANRHLDPQADLVIASAVLDLVDLPQTLPGVLKLVAPAGLFWFSINFDGETIWQPEHPDDEKLMRAYNRSMDLRVRYGRPAGHSRTGRRLFHQLASAGAEVLAAGASDWVVYPRGGRYEADEAYFLHHIVSTIDDALRGQPDSDPVALATWVALRHSQIEAAQLVYLAHQLDYVGRTVSSSSGSGAG